MNGIKGLYEKRGWFYYQPPTPKDGSGRPRPVALKTRDLVEAIERMSDQEMEIRMERAVLSGTLREVLPKYYEAKREDAVKTRRARKVILDQFMEDTGNPRADALSTEIINRWREGLAERTGRGGKGGTGKPLSGTTIKSYTITLRAFVNWLREEKILRHDPMLKLQRQTRVAKTRRHDFLTVEERERALGHEDVSPQVRLILHLGFFAGLRDAEMLAMTPDWIWISPDQTHGSISVQETVVRHKSGGSSVWRPKTREVRTIPMHPRLLAFIKGYGLKRPFMVMPGNEFWPDDSTNSKRYDARKALHTLAKRAQVRKLNFHIMRRTFATHLAMKGVTMAEIAGLLGDTVKVTEDHYAGFSPSRTNPLEVL